MDKGLLFQRRIFKPFTRGLGIKKGGLLPDHLLILNNNVPTSSAMPGVLLTLAQKKLGLSACPTALKSCQVEAVKVHHLGPSRHKVLHELLFRVRTSVNFSESPEL